MSLSSLVSSIHNSRGRYGNKRKVKKAADTVEKKSVRKAAAKQKPIKDTKKRKANGKESNLLRMKRLREERELDSGRDEESATITPIEREETDEVRGAVSQQVQPVKPQTLSIQPDGEALIEGEERCSLPEKVAEEPKDEKDGMFGDLFKQVEEEETSAIGLLIASLPDIPAQELLEEAEEIKTLLRRRGGIQR